LEQFKKAMKFTSKWEGGYVNHPDDPGSITYRGISRRFHPKWEGWKFVDEKNFLEADKYVDEFYFDKFWLPSGCDNYSMEYACCIFDASVNCGIKRSLQWVEVGTGPESHILMRERYYNLLAEKRPSLKVFLKGWLNRTKALRDYINK
jgi:lysozyme family protein